MKMHKLILLIGICSGVASASKLPAHAKAPAKDCGKVIGCFYYANLVNDEGGLTPKDIDVHICTHVFYVYIRITTDASVEVAEPYTDTKGDGYKDMNNLRKKNPRIKTLATMQVMWDQSTNSYNYKPLVDPKLRAKLVKNIVTFVKKYGFNGVDIDTSNPPPHSASPSDKENFVSLLKALRERFDKEHLILFVSVDPIEETAKRSYDIKGISTYVDFINLMTTDFHREDDIDKKLGHPSPLYHSSKENEEERKKNIDYVVNYWISQHAPASKLIIAVTTEGASYTLADPKKFGRGAPISKEPGELNGMSGYNAICSLVKEWTYFYDEEQQVTYIHKGKRIIALDDVRSIRAKAEYVNKKHLGGALGDNIDIDDYSGQCGEKFPLMKTLRKVLKDEC